MHKYEQPAFSELDQSMITAIKQNNLTELKRILERSSTLDINRKLLALNNCAPPDGFDANGKTILGLASFYGCIDMVKFLVEEKQADVNAPSEVGDTPLHEVLHGDTHPFNHLNPNPKHVHDWSRRGSAHGEVAQYLLQQGANIHLKNSEDKTPWDECQWCAPFWIENFVGYRFFSNTGDALYYGNHVRPVFKAHLGLSPYEASADGYFRCTLL